MDEDGSELIAGHTIRYDILAIALGSISNDFGVPGVKEHCLYLDSRVCPSSEHLALMAA